MTKQLTRYEVMYAKPTQAVLESRRWALRIWQAWVNNPSLKFFASRTGAESVAKRLAQGDVEAGGSAIVVIYNEDGSTDAKFIF